MKRKWKVYRKLVLKASPGGKMLPLATHEKEGYLSLVTDTKYKGNFDIRNSRTSTGWATVHFRTIIFGHAAKICCGTLAFAIHYSSAPVYIEITMGGGAPSSTPSPIQIRFPYLLQSLLSLVISINQSSQLHHHFSSSRGSSSFLNSLVLLCIILFSF